VLLLRPLNLPADALKKAKSQASGSDISDVASEAKDKAKGLLKGKGTSALPANPLAAVADQNADVRDLATDYRDPAGAVQLNTASGESCVPHAVRSMCCSSRMIRVANTCTFKVAACTHCCTVLRFKSEAMLHSTCDHCGSKLVHGALHARQRAC
jgi:hypothetical protein